MSKPMKKPVKIVLIVFVAVVLLGICFGSVALYAHNEINKPRFRLPEDEPVASASALPTDKDSLASYTDALYEKTASADDIEASWYTDVNLGGDWTTPFAEADQDLILYIRDHLGGQIADLYPRVNGEIGNTEMLSFGVRPDEVTDFTATEGRVNEAGDAYDTDYYYIDVALDPAVLAETAAGVQDTDLYKSLAEKLSPAMTVTAVTAEPQEARISYKIDRVRDQVLNVDYTRRYQVKATVELTDEYSGMLRDGGKTAEITFPYEAAEHLSFKHYGVRFTAQSMAVTNGDMKALPADVKVNDAATKDDYTLTFTESDPEVISIDEDGVLTVKKAAEEPVTVTMTLEYDGHTYTDTMTIWVTELEVETNAQQ